MMLTVTDTSRRTLGQKINAKLQELRFGKKQAANLEISKRVAYAMLAGRNRVTAKINTNRHDLGVEWNNVSLTEHISIDIPVSTRDVLYYRGMQTEAPDIWIWEFGSGSGVKLDGVSSWPVWEAWLNIQLHRAKEELRLPLGHAKLTREIIANEIAKVIAKNGYVPSREPYTASDGKNYESVWMHLGGELLGTYDPNNTGNFLVSHPTAGIFTIPATPIHAAIEHHGRLQLNNVLAGQATQALPALTLNNQASRVQSLCRDAIKRYPDLKDASGTPIAPLVNQHLPELLRRHAEAVAAAPHNQMTEIDAQLAEGIERVRKAVDEALLLNADQKRQDLSTQLRFLELRHPTESQHLKT